MKVSFSGLIAAPYTPFRSDGELALDVIPKQAALVEHNGMAGAFICGTTGEFASLSTVERHLIAENWISAKSKAFPLIVHVGGNHLEESRDLARHAKKIGAQGIATLAPNFFKPLSLELLVNWCERVAAAAPDLPFYYYHMPVMTGVSFSMRTFLERAAANSPQPSNPSLNPLITFHPTLLTHTSCSDYPR